MSKEGAKGSPIRCCICARRYQVGNLKINARELGAGSGRYTIELVCPACKQGIFTLEEPRKY